MMASVALFARLRWGEVNGLKWEDIDLDRAAQAVNPSQLPRRRAEDAGEQGYAAVAC